MNRTTFECLGERAARQSQAQDWHSARATWIEALSIVPDSADAMLELSYVESLIGNYRKAHEWCLLASKHRTSSVEANISLVKRLRSFNEGKRLRELACRLLNEQDVAQTVLVECATQLSNLNEFDLALRCAEAAVANDPGDLRACLVRGQLHAYHGRIEQAEKDFHWALERNPRIATGWWMLARLRRQTAQANHVPQLRALLATPGLRPGEIAATARALHKELDELGDHSGAWAALETLCAAMRSIHRHDPLEARALVDALVSWVPVEEQEPLRGGSERTPVFIVGMHRSGTTLLERLLDASPQVRGLGELYDFTSAMREATDYQGKIPIDRTMVKRASGVNLAEVGRLYLDGVSWRLGIQSHFTDKQPANFLSLGFICKALPQARILHLVRDPVETCFSNLRELFAEMNSYSYDQQELADYFLQYRRLMEHWHEAFPGRILDVDYSKLTTDPEVTMRKVAAFCGLDYIDDMKDPRSHIGPIATASAVQAREPIVRRSVPKWVPYARQLQPLIFALRQGGLKIADSPV